LSIFLLAGALHAQTGPPCAFERALRLHQSGNLAEAEREYRACAAAEPGRVDVRSNLGAVLAKEGRYQEAIDQYRQALPGAGPWVAPSLRFNLALAYYKSAQIGQAVAEFETLHTLRPGDPNLALLLGDCYLRTGEFAKAVDLLARFDNPSGEQAAVDYVLGMALIRSGRIQEGQLHVDRILRKGESAEGRLLLGSALFARRDYPRAVAEFARADALNPDLPSLQSYYGQALLFTGDADGASTAFRKALAADPNDYDANYQLASILAHHGKTDEARPLLQRAALLRPGAAEPRAALEHGFGETPPVAYEAGIAPGAPAPPIAPLDFNRLARPMLLVFGSYTCPKLRFSAAGLKRLYAAYGDRIDFRLVYIREAHAEAGSQSGWQSTINQRDGISLPPARDLAEKEAHAALCLRQLAFSFPSLVDSLDGAAEKAYAAWPSRVYLVGAGGRVRFNSRLGELELRPADLERAMREALGQGSEHAR
jgi:tetratricopeptide (TPR) repeat protein